MHTVKVFIELTNFLNKFRSYSFFMFATLDIKSKKSDLHRGTFTNTRRQVIRMKFSALTFSARVMKQVVLHL